jgi:flagellar protein FlaI
MTDDSGKNEVSDEKGLFDWSEDIEGSESDSEVETENLQSVYSEEIEESNETVQTDNLDSIGGESGIKNDKRGSIGLSDTEAKDLMRDDYKDFHEGIINNSEIVEEYEVHDYAEIQILYNPYINENLYRVVEPDLTELEKVLRIKVSKDIQEDFENIAVESMNSEERREKVRELAKKHLERQKTLVGKYGNKTIEKINSVTDSISGYVPSDSLSSSLENYEREKFDTITEENIERVVYYVVRDFADYEKLTPIMRDENIEDISCNSPDVPVFLYHKVHRDVITNVMYSQDELDEFVASLAQSSGKHISIAEPDLQGRLPDGSRMQLTYSDEISDEGSNFTIRKFQEEPFTPIDLIEFNTFSLSQMAYLWLAIQNEKSLIFAGGTASGKTTSMNAISLFIPPRAKIVSIEDTREITLRHSNWIKSVTRDSFGGGGTGEVDMYDLLRDALRQRPEYIIVGEIRGEEARTLFQAMSTGHTTYSTMHADDVGAAVRRLENEPINLPRQMLSSLDILSVQIRMIDDGDVMRRCKEMVEIVDIDSDTNEIKSKTTFEYNPDKDVVSYKGDSDILEEIKNINSWSQSELEDELERRKTVLRYLKEEVETRDYEIISSVLRTYMQDKDLIMEQIETGDLLKGK